VSQTKKFKSQTRVWFEKYQRRNAACNTQLHAGLCSPAHWHCTPRVNIAGHVAPIRHSPCTGVGVASCMARLAPFEMTEIRLRLRQSVARWAQTCSILLHTKPVQSTETVSPQAHVATLSLSQLDAGVISLRLPALSACCSLLQSQLFESNDC